MVGDCIVQFVTECYPARRSLCVAKDNDRVSGHYGFAQVAESLRDDLDASWNTWHQITAFMNAHGTYFLHPALAQPADFAARRQNCIS